MKNARLIYTSLVRGIGALLLALAGCQPPTLQEALDGLAVGAIEQRKLVGVGVSVRLPDGRVLQADAGSTAPSTPAAAYDVHATRQVVGSVTKLYIATLVMQLVEEGRVSLDDTIERWVEVPDAERITVRMLLDHTSGLGECLAELTPEERRRVWTPAELIARAVARGPMAAPGDRYAHYSNTNFVILAQLIEDVTGETWTERVASRITRPLGLGATASATTPEGRQGLVAGWANINGNWVSSYDLADPSTGWGNGAVAATNDDVMEFARAFFAGELFARRETLEQMLAFTHDADPAALKGLPPHRIGLAVHRFAIEDVTLIGHLGHAPGYDSAALRDPDTGALIVVTTNTDVVGAGGLIAYDIARYLRARGVDAN